MMYSQKMINQRVFQLSIVISCPLLYLYALIHLMAFTGIVFYYFQGKIPDLKTQPLYAQPA